MQDFRNLTVWQLSRKLTKSIYEVTSGYPASEEFGLKSQMRRAAVRICANIAEGCGRGTDPDFGRFLYTAMGSACELECEAILSGDLGFMTSSVEQEIVGSIGAVKRTLASLIARVVKAKHPPTASHAAFRNRSAKKQEPKAAAESRQLSADSDERKSVR